jgi:RNA polymerase sigma factor (sigma-70 family)
MNPTAPSGDTAGPRPFSATHWSLVLAAQGDATTEAREALAELCRTYWYPLYAFVRRQGHPREEAEDLTQAFFARLIEKDFVGDADRAKGRFRSFLLVALKRFLADEWGRAHAQKRGGFQPVLSIDSDLAESRLGAALQENVSPDVLFERQWALTLLDQVRARLREEYAASGRADLFENLEGWLTRDDAARPQAEIAARLQLTVPAVKMAVQRLRARYRALLRAEIGRTVGDPAEIDGEIRHLFALFGA